MLNILFLFSKLIILISNTTVIVKFDKCQKSNLTEVNEKNNIPMCQSQKENTDINLS